jgi:chemotaxis protein MotB
MAEEAGSEGGAPEWMVSYADINTIMMAFFVVLYASTSASGDKDKGGKSGEPAEGGKEPVQRVAEGIPGIEGKPGGGGNTNDDRMQKVFESLYHRFGPEWTMTNCWSGGPPALHGRGKPGPGFGGGDGDRPAIKSHGHTRDSYSVMVAPKTNDNIVAGGRLYFPEASAELTAEQVKLLRSVANDLAGKMQKIEIRGHSSRRPLAPGSHYTDHWDLAYARCRVVEKCLASQDIDVRRIRLSVAGPNEPMEQDADSPTLAQDARVEIRLLNEWVKEPTASSSRH